MLKSSILLFSGFFINTVSHNSTIGISNCNKTLIRLSSKHVTTIEYGYSKRWLHIRR